MIRITSLDELLATRLFLEGKLSGASVEELDKCWQKSTANQSSLLVDLTNVSYVDDQGKALLARMHRRGIKLFSARLMTKCLIEEIKRNRQ